MGVGAIIVSTRIFISMHIISAMPMSEENAKADKSYQGVQPLFVCRAQQR